MYIKVILGKNWLKKRVRLEFLVNADRVKKKIPRLLVNGSTTKKRNWNNLMRYRYRLE
jgi:hypothetical protein